MHKKGKWEDHEEQFIIDKYNSLGVDEISIKLNRTIPAIRGRAVTLRREGRLEQAKREEWCKEDEQFIIDNYEQMDITNMAKVLGTYNQRVSNKMVTLKREGIIKEEKKYKYKTRDSEFKKRQRRLQLEREAKKRLEQEERKRKIRLKKYRAKKKKEKEEMQRIVDRSIEEDRRTRDYGIGDKKDSVVLEEDCWYQIKIKPHDRRVEGEKFRCKLIQRTEDHATFKKPSGVRESFLINDILLNEIKIKELER